MSIQNVATSFVNVSDAPYVIDEAWINNVGLAATAAGTTLAFPGLYPQGSSILSVHLCSPETALAQNLGQGVIQVWATGGVVGNVLVLDTVTLANPAGVPGVGLGSTLPQDSWLYASLQYAATGGAGLTGKALGVVVKWTKLTQTQNPGLGL